MARHFYALAALILVLNTVFTSFGAYASEFKDIEWTDLIPAEDLDALLNPPEYLSQIEDGSSQDSVSAFKNKELEDDSAKRFQQALASENVITDFDNKAVRLPGFVVPLAQNEDRKVTAFFIVPYFGACLHMPPPPPNQIIYATSEKGLTINSLYDPFWFSGTLTIERHEKELGTSAYSLALANVQPYEEE